LSPALSRPIAYNVVAATTTRYAAHGTFKSALPLLRASPAIAPTQCINLTEGKPPVVQSHFANSCSINTFFIIASSL